MNNKKSLKPGIKPEIGIIGGSGFYEFLKGKEIELATPYGGPSDKILLTEYAGKKLAFLPRHGKRHQLPPHKINYRANLYALKQLGVSQIIAPTAVGSLKPGIKPGDFVIPDQFIDRTKSRKDTFFNGELHCPLKNNEFSKTTHISSAQPYCPELRKTAINACENANLCFHPKATVVVIEGPRFSSTAESSIYSQYADIINMTQYPEAILARELEICYLNISLVTDYDAGVENQPEIEPVTTIQVIETFQENTEKLKQLILNIISALPPDRACECNQALKGATL